MDGIVDRLSGIELAATRIVDAAMLEKTKLQAQTQEYLKAYDARIDSETEQQLNELKETLDAQMNQELGRLKDDTAKMIAMIEMDYEANHEKLAEEILQKMIKG